MPATGKMLNYTTKIPATQTVGECHATLAAAGASSVSVHFEDGRPAGLSFSLKTPHGPRDFTLPVNVDGVQQVLMRENRAGKFRSDGARRNAYETRDHATNVAWRVIKDWLEANLALIAAGMAGLDEVMLPYLHVDDSHTLYQRYREREDALALEAGDA